MNYKILKITSYYKDFLDDFYNRNESLKNSNYLTQYEELMKKKYAWSDYFKNHSEKLGIEVIEIVHNAIFLQGAWENEFSPGGSSNILNKQISFYKPDIIFFQDIKSFSGQYIKSIKEKYPFVKLIFGHSCSPFSKSDLNNYKFYDFILTCLPYFKKEFEKNGIKSYKHDHGFESSLLNYIPPGKIKKDLIFLGSLVASKDFHNERLEYIEHLIKEKVDIKLYTSFSKDTILNLRIKQFAYITSNLLDKLGLNSINQRVNALKKVSACKEIPKNINIPKELKSKTINKSYYGIEMYNLLAGSLASLNIHGGIAGDYAVNMRLFETTGVGTLLLTDHKSNIRDFFEPDYEIVTFKSVDECVKKSKWLLENPNQALEIARAGQQRTLKSHNLESRFAKIHEIIKENLS